MLALIENEEDESRRQLSKEALTLGLRAFQGKRLAPAYRASQGQKP
jgi:hypothetical protein